MNKHSILIVEDSPEYLLYLERILCTEFRVEKAASFNEAVALAANSKFDLLILDVNLGDENGFDLVVELKKNSSTQNSAILYLTSRGSVVDKMTGFSLGADDFIVKPVDQMELLARVKAILRRTLKGKIEDETYALAGVHLNWSTQKVHIKENDNFIEVFLTLTEKKILRELMTKKGRIVSRERMIDVAWGDTISVIDRNVDAHIYSVRKKLKSHSMLIKTVSGIGYRFADQA